MLEISSLKAPLPLQAMRHAAYSDISLKSCNTYRSAGKYIKVGTQSEHVSVQASVYCFIFHSNLQTIGFIQCLRLQFFPFDSRDLIGARTGNVNRAKLLS